MMTQPFHKARPRELKVPLLSNPGKGCATFQRFGGDSLNPGEAWSEEGPLTPQTGCEVSADAETPRVAEGYLPSTVSYCRWFWDVLEPEEGRLDFGMVEGALATAQARGQTLEVRLMPFGSHRQPQLPGWYRESRAVRMARTDPPGGRSHLEPDYDSPEYYDTWGRVIAEFGRRFDGHPALESVDIAVLGPWGEGAGEASAATVDRFVDLYVKAHPKTALLINTDGYQFESGVARGCGWRCDCFGDLRGRKESAGKPYLDWNHTYEFYPQAVARARAASVWQTRPVVFETCATPLGWRNRWYAGPGDLEFVIGQGLKFHASVFMPKSCPIPPEYLGPLARFCDAMGYRFVLRQAMWQNEVRRGGEMEAEFWIENTGVAPVYRDYRLALRIGSAVVPLDCDPRTWLPGDAIVERKVRVPASLPAGETTVMAGIVRPGEEEPAVRFASEGADAAGWIPLGPLRLA